MKLHRSCLLGLAVVTLAACSDTATSVPADGPAFAISGAGHRVVGSGHVQSEAGLREFTFHAIDRPNGSVGSYKVVLPNGLFLESDVTCLTVDGGTGWVGGVIRDTNADIVVVGSTSMFYAVDNGEGPDAEPDVVSTVLFNQAEGMDQAFCDEQNLLPDLELTVTDGNVQVH